MGVTQSRFISLQIILFFFVLSFALAADIPDIPQGSGSCCIPNYFSSTQTVIFETGAFAINDQATCTGIGSNYLFVDSCYTNGELVQTSYGNEGCCCEEYIPGLFRSVDVGSSNGYVSEPYCNVQGYNFVGAQASCDQACAAGTSFYRVYGQVLDESRNPLESITLSVLTDSSKVATSNDAGDYEFSEFFEEGTYTFRASTPSSYPLICDTSEQFTRTVNSDDFFIEIILECEERTTTEPICEPFWEVEVNGQYEELATVSDGGWGECIYYGTETGYLRSRNIRDANSCGLDQNAPAQFTAEGCEGLSLSQECNDGQFQQGEICDGGVLTYQGTTYSTELGCSTVFGAGYTGNVQCDPNSCTLDFSNCQAPCDCSDTSQCSNECQFICQDHPTCQFCDEALQFIPAGAPTGDLFALYDYLDSNPIAGLTSGIEYILGTRDVKVEWQYTDDAFCKSELLGFEVMICRGDSGTCDLNYPPQFVSLNGISQTSHTFFDVLEPDTSFCYNVIARTQSGDVSAFSDGSYPCYETGDLACMQVTEPGLNCHYDAEADSYNPAECREYSESDSRTNLQLFAQTACQVDEQCVETQYVEGGTRDYEQGAMCLPQYTCDNCNGMFGLFANYNLNYDNNYACEELLFAALDNAPLPGYQGNQNTQLAQCYKDETETLFSFYDSCQHVDSCYDYRSQGTCSQDPCFKFTSFDENNGRLSNTQVNCEWIEMQPTELGLETGVGVCRPTQVENQDCQLCDTDSPLGFCGQGMCELYGDCYQKDTVSKDQELQAFPASEREFPAPACLHQSEMSCYLYEEQTQCEGLVGSTPYVDVRYRSGLTIEEDALLPTDRIFGTNAQSSFSDDLFGFGDCRWDATFGCFKDSNNYYGSIEVDDCQDNSLASSNCFRDNTPPLTTAFLKEGDTPLYGFGELLELQFSVEDADSAPEEITTYVSLLSTSCQAQGCVQCAHTTDPNCLDTSSTDAQISSCEASGCYVYPQYTFEDYRSNANNLQDTIEDGEHLLLYFSEDKARNLEEIKTARIDIDNDKPVISNFQYSVTSYRVYEDQYTSDLTLSIDVSEDSICMAQLYDVANPDSLVPPGVYAFNANPEPYTFEVTYNQLQDRTYGFRIECVDDFLNQGIFETGTPEHPHITIDADASITDLMPQAEVYNSAELSSLTFEATTETSASCRFDTTTNIYANSQYDFDTSNGISHSKSFTDTNLPSTSGIYRLSVSCDFDNGELTEGEPGDIIVFGIDNVAPQISITENGNDFRDNIQWKSSRTIQLDCEDAYDVTPTGFNKGCQAIYYCITESPTIPAGFETSLSCPGGELGTIISDNDASSSLSAQVPLNLGYEYTYLYYYATDKGGAQSNTIQVNTRVRDSDIQQPDILIS